MVSHLDVARAFARGDKAKGHNMYTDGRTIWSYGDWFPIAHWLKDGQCLFNKDKYSITTTKHQSYVRGTVSDVIPCTTHEIRKAVDYPDDSVVVVEREKDIKSLDEALIILRTVCRNMGMKYFPRKFLHNLLMDKMILERL